MSQVGIACEPYFDPIIAAASPSKNWPDARHCGQLSRRSK